MKITCTGRKVNLKDAFQQRVETKLAKLDKLFGNGSWIPGSTEGACNPELTYTIVIDENGVTVGVNSVLAEIGTKVTVYNLNGVRVLYNADRDALKALRKGIYVVNGKKVVIK